MFGCTPVYGEPLCACGGDTAPLACSLLSTRGRVRVSRECPWSSAQRCPEITLPGPKRLSARVTLCARAGSQLALRYLVLGTRMPMIPPRSTGGPRYVPSTLRSRTTTPAGRVKVRLAQLPPLIASGWLAIGFSLALGPAVALLARLRMIGEHVSSPFGEGRSCLRISVQTSIGLGVSAVQCHACHEVT